MQRADERTQHLILEALNADNWSNGKQVQTFERDFAAFLGCKCVIMTANATIALKLGLLAHDIGPGDEVIVPALTFPSVALTILECGALPVICDIDPDNCCLSASTLEQVLSKRTRAIIPTHLYCTQCDMPPILDIARRHGLIVIEDCAHVPGSRRNGRFTGTWGQGAIFSFNQKKPLSCGEGGCFVTDDSDLGQRIRWLRDFDTPPKAPATRIQRMAKVSEFQAAVLNGQLKSLPDRLHAIECQTETLRKRLENLPAVHVLSRLGGTEQQTVYSFCLRITGLSDAAAFRCAVSAELNLQMDTTYAPLDINPALNCSCDRQFRPISTRIDNIQCKAAHKVFYQEAMRFPGHYLAADAAAVEDIATAITKVLPFFINS
ncbi:MAG: DegT/DnrJ/EryC1/StrS family aminotransferase [Opitutaceae bacterium]|jgi:dTDP-4-amino-4,6-dideoxygalactose transaminase